MSAELANGTRTPEEKLISALTSYIENREQTGENIKPLIDDVPQQKRGDVLTDQGLANGGNSVLHTAAVRGDTEFVEYVLSSVEDKYKLVLLNQVNSRGNTPISNAATFAHVETLKCMLTCINSEQRFINLQRKNDSGMTALCRVAERGHTAALKEILGSVRNEVSSELLLSQNTDLDTALILAAEAGHVQLLQCIMDTVEEGKRFDLLNMTNSKGHSALHRAAWFGHFDVARIIMTSVTAKQKEALLLKQDRLGNTCLITAAFNGHSEVIGQLISDLEFSFVPKLLKRTNRNGKTALHQAATKGHIGAMLTIMNTVSDDVNHELLMTKDNISGETALSLAVHHHQKGAVKYLLHTAGLDTHIEMLSASNKKGQTPLHISALGSYPGMIETLLDSVVDYQLFNLIKQEDNDGLTASSLALKGGHIETSKKICDLLNISKQHGSVEIEDNFTSENRSSYNVRAQSSERQAASELAEQNESNGAGLDMEEQEYTTTTTLEEYPHHYTSLVTQVFVDMLSNIKDSNYTDIPQINAAFTEPATEREKLFMTKIVLIEDRKIKDWIDKQIAPVSQIKNMVENLHQDTITAIYTKLGTAVDDHSYTELEKEAIKTLFYNIKYIIGAISVEEINSKIEGMGTLGMSHREKVLHQILCELEGKPMSMSPSSHLVESEEAGAGLEEHEYTTATTPDDDPHYYSSLVTQTFIAKLSKAKKPIYTSAPEINPVFTAPPTEREKLFMTKIVLVENKRITDWIDKQLAPVSQIENMVENLHQDTIKAIYTRLGSSKEDHVYTELDEEEKAIKTLFYNITHAIGTVSVHEITSKIEGMGTLGMSHREKVLHQILCELEGIPMSASTHSVPSAASAAGNATGRPAVFGAARVLHDFDRTDRKQISLKEGEIIEVYSKMGVKSGWWKGAVIRNGQVDKIGCFPMSHVKEIEGNALELSCL